MGRLSTLQPRVATLSPTLGRVTSEGPRKPWALNPLSPPRIRGRALQTRNDRIKARDLYTCAHCGKITTQLEVDHRIPLSQGGSEDDDNLQLLCGGLSGCHAQKSKTENRG